MATKKASKIPVRRSDSSVSDFPVVGIGASAGGFEALEQFFLNLPPDTGMAFVIIQHLDPNHIDILPELLQRLTKMGVTHAGEGIRVKPGNVYVIPPNKTLTISRGTLHLKEPLETRGLRLPVDAFFHSLAEDRESNAVGIILSGMGSDGSLGAKAIKEHNGIILIQDPATARFDGMPGSASDAVTADIIAPANELPKRMIDLLKISPIVLSEQGFDTRLKTNLEKIIQCLKDYSGHDFSEYKKNTLIRRIERRKNVHLINSLSHYTQFLQENPQEVEILFKELLIGVTNFFRDETVWNYLRDSLLPDLFKTLPQGYVLRAWVPGCSTGEEAYSLAIVFREAAEKYALKKDLSMQIFATDLDSDAIDRARKGIYSRNILAEVSEERISRYFIQENGGYRINSAIRETVVFATQNIIKDPPFTKLDILSCRNMLIYMESALQHKLIKLFHYSLHPGGLLILGTSETIGSPNEGFIDLDARLKIHKRSPLALGMGMTDLPSAYFNKENLIPVEKDPIKMNDNIQTLANQLLLQRYAPASLLVNDKGDIIYISGRTGKYLEPMAGKANMNIYAMLIEGLREVIPIAFRKAMMDYEPVTLQKVKYGSTGRSHLVNLTIQRIDNPPALKDLYCIVFNDVISTPEADAGETKRKSSHNSLRFKQMEAELKEKEEEIQILREEMQTSQEELKSTNEEMQSTNEELQSTNEELTTSKEEMQSLNEELQTVNLELQIKVNDFMRASDDMKNLLNSTEIATLFLDRDLNIRRFTDQLTRIFKLRNTDIGRPFTDQVNDLKFPDLGYHSSLVLQTLTPFETAIDTLDGRWFSVRIMPYRTLDDRIDGLVITFTDITVAKNLELELKAAYENLKKNISET